MGIDAAEVQHAGNGRLLMRTMGRTKGVEEVKGSGGLDSGSDQLFRWR